MTDIKIVPAAIHHLKSINARPFDAQWIAGADSLPPGPSWTVLLDGHPLIIAGMRPMWRGVAEAWAVTDSEIDRAGYRIARAAKESISIEMFFNDITRLQCVVNVNNSQAMRFAEWLGFEREGDLVKFGPEGDDYVIRAIIQRGV